MLSDLLIVFLCFLYLGGLVVSVLVSIGVAFEYIETLNFENTPSSRLKFIFKFLIVGLLILVAVGILTCILPLILLLSIIVFISSGKNLVIIIVDFLVSKVKKWST